MACLMIVDDEEETRKVLGRMLRAASYEVLEAGDVDTAMHLCRTANIDVLIADILMPGKSGLELIKEIQQEFPKIQIVAISGGFGLGFHPTMPLADTLGVRCTLAKPFSVDDLLTAVRQTLAA